MKPHQQKKNSDKKERKRRRKTNGDKKPNRKRRKCYKTPKSKKNEKGWNFFFDKSNKKKESKIKFLSHGLLASTLSVLMLALW
jgi:hypothetical protein